MAAPISHSPPRPPAPARTAPKPEARSAPPPKPAPKAEQAQSKDTFEPARAPKADTQGQQQARDAVKVKTVGDEREALEKGARDAHQENTKAADQVFSLAGKDAKDLPPGVEVAKGSDRNRAELIARNKEGEVTARTVAIRDGDETTVQKTTYDQGRANLSSTTSSAGGDLSTTQASWKAEPSHNPEPAPSIDSLKNSRDPDVEVQQQSVRHDGDKLVSSEYAQGKTGITQTTKTYFQQSKDDATHEGNGIKDDFEDKFSDSRPVDVVNTHSVSIPAEGAKGPDGKQATPQVSDTATFSQGAMRLERDAGTQQYEVEDDFPQGFRPAASDLANPDDLSGVSEGDQSPVQWKLEQSGGNTYDAQTFVEGQPDLSTTTHREARGSTVTETVSGKVPSPEEGEDPVSISSRTEQTYARDGSLARLHRDATDAEGTRTVTDFNRATRPGQDGLEIDEHLEVQRTTEDGETYGVDRRTESRLSNQGVQLVSSDETVTGPDGTTGRTRMDKAGTQTFINGAEVKGQDDLQRYPIDAQRLATQSGADTFKEAQGYLSNGGANALNLLEAGEGDGALRQRLVSRFGEQNVDTAFRVQSGAVGGLQAAGGLAGVVSSTNELVNGIRDQDFGKIATGLAGEISSGMAVKSGGEAFLNAVRGLSPATVSAESKAVSTALRTAGWLEKVPGVSEGLATSGGIAAGTASKVLGKLGGAGSVLGVAASGYELYNAIESGNGNKIAQASVGLAGATAASAVLIGAAAGSIAPGVGTAIGAGIGLATFGVQKIIGLFDDSETDIADVRI